jgi:hypothetical protein
MSQAFEAQQDAADALAAQARRTAAYMVKCRARDYARRPMSLAVLYPGLAAPRHAPRR